MATEESVDGGRAEGAPTATTASMRARRWVVAANYRDPTDYGIPPLPDWTVYRDDNGALALGVGGKIFLRADDPVDVRR